MWQSLLKMASNLSLMQHSQCEQNALLCTSSVCPVGKSPFGCLDGRGHPLCELDLNNLLSVIFVQSRSNQMLNDQLIQAATASGFPAATRESSSLTNSESQMPGSVCLPTWFWEKPLLICEIAIQILINQQQHPAECPELTYRSLNCFFPFVLNWNHLHLLPLFIQNK